MFLTNVSFSVLALATLFSIYFLSVARHSLGPFSVSSSLLTKISTGIYIIATVSAAHILASRPISAGYDYAAYLLLFRDIQEFGDIFLLYNTEYLYLALNYLIKKIGSTPYVFTFSSSSVFFVVLFFAIKNFRRSDVYLNHIIIVMILLTSSTFYFFATNALRQGLAAAFALLALSIGHSRNLSRSIFLIAVFFHHSSFLIWASYEIAMLQDRGDRLFKLLINLSIPVSAFIALNYAGQMRLGADIGNIMSLVLKALVCLLLLATLYFFSYRSGPKVMKICIKAIFTLSVIALVASLVSIDAAERLLMYSAFFSQVLMASIIGQLLFGNPAELDIKLSHFSFGFLFLMFPFFYLATLYIILGHPSIIYTLNGSG